MAILRPMLMPTVGVPQTAVASRRPRNMSQKDFYSLAQNQAQNQIQQPSAQQTPTSNSSPVPQANEQVFEQAPLTGDYIQEQLSRMNQRQAPPMLQPGARVKSPESELVQPSSFQAYYNQLNTIRGTSEQLLAAAQARGLFNRMNSGSGGSTGGSRGGGQDFGNGIPANPKANFKFAQDLAGQFGWDANELSAWYTLGMKESGWRNTAQNPKSTAYGIGQFLNSTWKGVGIAKTSDPRLQVLAMARYIQKRYGSPSRALAFHKRNNWY